MADTRAQPRTQRTARKQPETDVGNINDFPSDAAAEDLLSTGDIIELLTPSELRSCIHRLARAREDVRAALQKSFEDAHPTRKRVPSFEQFVAMIEPVSPARTMQHDDMQDFLAQVGRLSSWHTKRNALSALRVRAKQWERLRRP